LSVQVYENVVYPHKEELVEAIKKYSSRDQSKTSVRLYQVTAKVYSPHKYDRDDFAEYLDWLQTLDILPSKKVCPKMWGMHYESNDVCKPHMHDTYGWAAIHYLDVDEGCGMLGTIDEVIEPKNDMMVIMPADYYHYVLPAENPEAQRVLMVFNMDY
jgi:hypothetical protein